MGLVVICHLHCPKLSLLCITKRYQFNLGLFIWINGFKCELLNVSQSFCVCYSFSLHKSFVLVPREQLFSTKGKSTHFNFWPAVLHCDVKLSGECDHRTAERRRRRKWRRKRWRHFQWATSGECWRDGEKRTGRWRRRWYWILRLKFFFEL